jgi:hypothetical protein
MTIAADRLADIVKRLDRREFEAIPTATEASA